MKILFRLVKRILKFLKLSWEEKKLLSEAFFLSGIIRFAILFLPFYKLATLAGKYKEESSVKVNRINVGTINNIAWAISLASRYTPWESKCLVQALTGLIMLRKRKVSSTLYLGVAKDKEGKPLAHAWLRSGTIIVTGGHRYDCFTQVAKFASQ